MKVHSARGKDGEMHDYDNDGGVLLLLSKEENVKRSETMFLTGLTVVIRSPGCLHLILLLPMSGM